MAKEEGLGISKFINYGNGADLNELDLLQYYIDNPETEVVCLYMESVSDGRAFMKIACECTRKKPLIVMKSGRTSSGMRAALSHTSSLAGSDDVFDACLKQLAKGIAEASKQSDKPVLTSFLPRYLVSEAVNFLERQGIPN